MMLSDGTILELIERGDLAISGFSRDRLQAASVELHLSSHIRVFDKPEKTTIDVDRIDGIRTTKQKMPARGYVLQPGDFILGSTVERVTLPSDIVGRIEGKSTLGRIGLAIHATAGFIDPGFTGDLTLEISNLARHRIQLRAGMKIGQMALMRMDQPALRPYGHPELGSHYQGQSGPTKARLKRNC